MSTPSPFEVARGIGNNFNRSFKRAEDENAIEQILSQAVQSGDPEVLQNSIGQILSQVSPERQPAAVQYLQSSMQNIQKKQLQGQRRAAAIKEGINPDLSEPLQLQQLKNQQPAKAAGGLSGQPVPPQFADALNDIVTKNANSNADQLALAFDKAGVPRTYSGSYIENRRRQDESKKAGSEFASIREKSVADYVNQALGEGEEAENLKFTIGEVKKALQGDIAGPGLTALAKNNPYTQILVGLTPDEATLQAANKKLLEGSKNIFGSKPTEREIFLLLNSMLPSIGKTKEANLAGLSFIERINDMKVMHSDIVNELTDGGTKFVPDLERQVNAQMRPYGESLRKDLSEAVEAVKELEQPQKGKKDSKAAKSGEIQVRAPDGKIGYMTQENIDKAKANNVVFTPVK